MSLRKLIYLEYAVAFVICLLIYLHQGFSLWLFVLLLFVPDVFMIGYLFNQKIGAYLYNFGHSLILPVILFAVAFFNDLSNLLMISLIWLAHIFLDRSIGFGLKYISDFKETHLQKID